MALAAPMTLLLRTLPVNKARVLSRLLKNPYVRFIRHPIIASILNVGGLWLLYTTSLFNLMHEHILLYVFIHLHIFLAGYLFTIAFIYFDPTPLIFLCLSISYISSSISSSCNIGKIYLCKSASSCTSHRGRTRC